MHCNLILFLILSIFFNVRSSSPYQELVDNYQKWGNEQYMLGEAITQSDHALQAAYIAHICGAPEGVVIGLLFHDIGQICLRDTKQNIDINYLHEHHDEIGAQWLEARKFPEIVVAIVRFHALAKITLCQKDAFYYDHLSQASQDSYHIQKQKYCDGRSTAVYTAFLNSPYKVLCEAARKCDDMAKIPSSHFVVKNFAIPNFELYKPMIDRVLKRLGQIVRDKDWICNIDTLHALMITNYDQFLEKIMAKIA